MSLALRPLHADLFVSPPHPRLGHTGLCHSLDPHVSILTAYRGVRSATTSCSAVESDMRSPIWSCVGKMRMVRGGSGGGMPGSCGWTGLTFWRFFPGRGLGTG